MAVMIGSSMIVRISTAYITPGPEGLVLKKGIQPNSWWMS